MESFYDFLKNHTVENVLLMYQGGLVNETKFLKIVKNYITFKINEGEVLNTWQQKIFDEIVKKVGNENVSQTDEIIGSVIKEFSKNEFLNKEIPDNYMWYVEELEQTFGKEVRTTTSHLQQQKKISDLKNLLKFVQGTPLFYRNTKPVSCVENASKEKIPVSEKRKRKTNEQPIQATSALAVKNGSGGANKTYNIYDDPKPSTSGLQSEKKKRKNNEHQPQPTTSALSVKDNSAETKNKTYNIYVDPKPSTSGLQSNTRKRKLLNISIDDNSEESDDGECCAIHIGKTNKKGDDSYRILWNNTEWLNVKDDVLKLLNDLDKTIERGYNNDDELWCDAEWINVEEDVLKLCEAVEEEEEKKKKRCAQKIQYGSGKQNISHQTVKKNNDFNKDRENHQNDSNREGRQNDLNRDRELHQNEDEEEFRYFQKDGESQNFVKKYGLMSRRMRFRFKPYNEKNPLKWLENAIDELMKYSCRQFQNDDIVGLLIESEEFPEKPLGVSFRKFSELTADVIMNVIAKVFQSNATFFSNETLSIRVDRIRPERGYGFSSVDGRCVDFNTFSISKNSIFTINMVNNNLCLAGALVVAIEFCRANCKRESLKQFLGKNGRTLLELRSRELCNQSNINLSEGGGYEQIVLFQEYFSEYTIVVYNDREGKTVYYEGARDLNKPCLNLLLENNHYNVILSLTGAFSARYFCERCRTKYSERNRHKRCPFQCVCCHAKPPCEKTDQLIKCNLCSRSFRGNNCFQNHKQTICNQFKKCEKCYTVYFIKKKEKHVCGFNFCQTCGTNQPLNHFCYMKQDKLNENKKCNLQKFLLIFFDLETMQHESVGENVFQHTVNLCVSQQVCAVCINNNNLNQNCNYCGQRQRIFRDKPVETFLEHVTTLTDKFNVTAVAHNLKGFDGCFVLKTIFSDVKRWQPEIIRSGTKLISITCRKSIRFIDSLNFIQMPLSKFSKSFNLTEVKGYFPHFFNKPENQNYVGPIPSKKYYGYDTMKDDDRSDFLNWYNQQVNNNTVFDMHFEIEKYCIADVDILRQGCLKFRDCFIETNNVDPLLECVTIASACNLVYRRNFLKPETIGLVPREGYRGGNSQSKIAIQWLKWEEHRENLNIKHAGNSREVRLPGNLIVDGYCQQTQTIYEFYGCFFHACPKCYANQVTELSTKKDFMFMRYENTMAKEDRIKRLGYNLITMWECEFRKQIKNNPALKGFCENCDNDIDTPLNPRDSFYGGRTNACKLYYKCEPGEKIKYFDVCSLYPFINKYGKYPMGHPKNVYVGHDECNGIDLNVVNGLIKCTILPPTDLYHPVLPYRCNGKLTFPLCRSCVETSNQNNCKHNDAQRQFVGTYVADELRKALSLGYRVIKISEIWEYDTVQYDKSLKTGGLFLEYVNTFLKIKQECSGWPRCETETDKQRYIDEYAEREGINLDKNKISKNPGLRMLSKIMLNCFWGKFGQRDNLQATTIINNPSDLFRLLMNPSVIVHNITIINAEVLLVTWDRVHEDVVPAKTVNVAIAAYTTSGARLELYKYLEKLGRRVLYYDTDSVIFTQKDGEWEPPVGVFLGDLTDEVIEYGDGSYITEFVSSGPKSYAYKVWCSNDQSYKSVCKVKGLTLHHSNSKLLNFDVMKSMICDNHPQTNIVLNNNIITRDALYNVLTKKCDKNYKINYTKRRRLNNCFDTLPYGYKLQ